MEDGTLEQEIFDMIVGRLELEDYVKEIPEEKLSFDTPVLSSMEPGGLALDSMDVLDLLAFLEGSYGISVPDEDIVKLTSIKNIADYIRSNGDRG